MVLEDFGWTFIANARKYSVKDGTKILRPGRPTAKAKTLGLRGSWHFHGDRYSWRSLYQLLFPFPSVSPPSPSSAVISYVITLLEGNEDDGKRQHVRQKSFKTRFPYIRTSIGNPLVLDSSENFDYTIKLTILPLGERQSRVLYISSEMEMH